MAVTADGISNQATKVKMTVHIGFVELCTAVTDDGKISNQATKVKKAVQIGFVKLCTAVTADGNYFKSGDRNENDRAFVKFVI